MLAKVKVKNVRPGDVVFLPRTGDMVTISKIERVADNLYGLYYDNRKDTYPINGDIEVDRVVPDSIDIKVLVDDRGEVLTNPNNTINAVYSKFPNVVVGENSLRMAKLVFCDPKAPKVNLFVGMNSSGKTNMIRDLVINYSRYEEIKETFIGMGFNDVATSAILRNSPMFSESLDEIESRFIPITNTTNVFHKMAIIFNGIISNKDNCVVIDPIDIGIHSKLFVDLWKSIFKLAVKYNTEVYATAYSIDALRGFYTAWKEFQENGSLTRVERDDTGSRPITIDLETLGDALETDVFIM